MKMEITPYESLAFLTCGKMDLYYGNGTIKSIDEYPHARFLIRLLQLNGIGKEYPQYAQKFIDYIVDMIQDFYQDIECIIGIERVIPTVSQAVNQGIKTKFDLDYITSACANFYFEEKVYDPNYSIKFIFESAKNKIIPIPAGEWQPCKKTDIDTPNGMIGKQMGDLKYVITREDGSISEAHERDSQRLFLAYPKFKKDFITFYKHRYLIWPSNIIYTIMTSEKV